MQKKKSGVPSDTIFVVLNDSEEEKYVYRKGIYMHGR